jgi:PAS domain S-box-containing protein
MDDQGLITYFNESSERTFGYRSGDVIGRELAEVIITPPQRDAHRRGLERYLSTGDSRILDRRIELTAMRADGSEFPAELTVTHVDLPGGMGFTGFVRDITERIETEQELRAARRRVIEAADAARERLTRDIHDGAQQHFVNTLINLQLAEQKWSTNVERSRELLEIAVSEAQAGIETLRELAAGIHPAILRDGGLAAALDALAIRLPIPVTLEVAQLELPVALQASVYFFCSEALANVIKHAAASTASVTVTRHEDQLTIEIRDDGVGGADIGSGGTGLIGLADRVTAHDGHFELSSPGEGSGTTITARIPLPA